MPQSTYQDYYWSTPRRVSQRPREYPFRALGDVATYVYEATYVVEIGAFTPTAIGTLDPENASVYLIAETKPEITTGRHASFRRTYATLPGTQTDNSRSQMVNLPGVTGPFPKVFGGYRIFQPDTTLLLYDAYAAQTVGSDSGAPGFYPTGGTYPLTFSGSTTAGLLYNDSAATLQTALNALTPVSNRGGVTVAGSYNSAGGLVVTFNSYAAGTINAAALTATPPAIARMTALNSGYTMFCELISGNWSGGTLTVTIFGATTAAIAFPAAADAATAISNISAAVNALAGVINRGGCVVTASASASTGVEWNSFAWTMAFQNPSITGNATSLTPVTGLVSVTAVGSGIIQTVRLSSSSRVGRILTIPLHGLAAGDTIYLKTATIYYPAISGRVTVLDANTISVSIDSSDSYAAAGTITECGKRTKQNYTPGSRPVPVSTVTRFSLTGLTPDPYQGEGDAFLQAIFSGSPAINYRVGDSARWPNELSSILALSTVKISAANI
ncbi:MAG: hypothetical protein H7343_12270 [Undibacterium sp.]|nr:hypothetical protein [Opitutaceae bacterium]